MKYIGIDGCRAGWFFAGLDDNDSWYIGILTCISELNVFLQESKLILVDIPIGLMENGPQERLCDFQARRVLSLRKASIFPAPCRQSLYCTSYKEACRVNHENTARKISRQSWAISEKIKQMDDYLSEVNTYGKIREYHPEVGLWALNNRTEMRHSKKTEDGLIERLDLLSKYCPQAEDIFIKAGIKYRANKAAKDDILDALSGAVTAKYAESLLTFPERPEKDAKGFSMEIVCANIMQYTRSSNNTACRTIFHNYGK